MKMADKGEVDGILVEGEMESKSWLSQGKGGGKLEEVKPNMISLRNTLCSNRLEQKCGAIRLLFNLS